jgi:hypothetical protein
MSLQLKVQKFKPFDHTKVATPIGLHDSNPLLELDVEPSTTIAAVKTLIEVRLSDVNVQLLDLKVESVYWCVLLLPSPTIGSSTCRAWFGVMFLHIYF